MDASQILLAQVLTFAGLIGATEGYIVLLRQRQMQRALAAERLEAAASGLRGLVRIFVAD